MIVNKEFFPTSLNQTTGKDDPEIRYLSADCGIQPRKSNNYGVPSDIIDVFKASSEQGYSDLNDFLANRLSNVSISDWCCGSVFISVYRASWWVEKS